MASDAVAVLFWMALAGVPPISEEELSHRPELPERIRQDAAAWTDPLGPPPWKKD